MKEKLDKVYDDRDILLIKRSENKDVVVLSLEDYNSMTETAYLLSTKANARQLLEAGARGPGNYWKQLKMLRRVKNC